MPMDPRRHNLYFETFASNAGHVWMIVDAISIHLQPPELVHLLGAAEESSYWILLPRGWFEDFQNHHTQPIPLKKMFKNVARVR